MVAVDTNVVVYGNRREVTAHVAARELVLSLAEGSDSWAIPWPAVYEFFSVVTNARIWKEKASTASEACNQIEAWLGSPSLTLLGETIEFWAVLGGFVKRPRVLGS